MPRGARKELATALGVEPRTLSNWAKAARDDPDGKRRPGPEGTTEEEWAKARKLVQGVIDEMGWSVGETTVTRELGGKVTLYLVRRVLAELKRERRQKTRAEREAVRSHVRVLARDVLWSIDATHLSRDCFDAAVLAECVRDVASTKTLGVSIGPPPTSEEVVVLLQRVVDRVGTTPLVLAADNGPENKDKLVEWCREQGVVLLSSAPHVPEHNPWVEHGNGEIKAETELGKGTRVLDVRATAGEVVHALEKIDGARPRATRGWRTARQVYRDLPAAEALVDRERFLEAARCAIDEAVQDYRNERERRLARREAVLRTLECFGLITRTRGRAPRAGVEAESVS